MLLTYCVMGVWGGVASYLVRKSSRLLCVANAGAAILFFHDAYTLPL